MKVARGMERDCVRVKSSGIAHHRLGVVDGWSVECVGALAYTDRVEGPASRYRMGTCDS